MILKKISILFALLLTGCVQQPVKLDTVHYQNGMFEVRITAFEEKRSFARSLAGAEYVFEARTNDREWSRVMVFHHDDYVPIDKKQVQFVNDQVAFMFMGWMYAVTTDAGQSWHTWDGNKVEIFSKERVGYTGIQSVEIEQNGKGKMFLNLIGSSSPVELHTEDFGLSWHVQN